MTRTLRVLVIAPLAVVPVLVALFGPWALTNGGMRSLMGILGPALVVAYPATIFFGLPMHLALVRQHCTRWRDYALTGVLLGAVPVAGYVLVAVMFDAKFEIAAMGSTLAKNATWGAIGVLVFGLCSAAVALAFRTLAFGRNDLTT
jgi:hypothetical protein